MRKPSQGGGPGAQTPESIGPRLDEGRWPAGQRATRGDAAAAGRARSRSTARVTPRAARPRRRTGCAQAPAGHEAAAQRVCALLRNGWLGCVRKIAVDRGRWGAWQRGTEGSRVSTKLRSAKSRSAAPLVSTPEVRSPLSSARLRRPSSLLLRELALVVLSPLPLREAILAPPAPLSALRAGAGATAPFCTPTLRACMRVARAENSASTCALGVRILPRRRGRSAPCCGSPPSLAGVLVAEHEFARLAAAGCCSLHELAALAVCCCAWAAARARMRWR